MICAQAIIHFRPNESYEKYLKLLMSVMVLIQLFAPVGRLLFGGGTEKTAKLLEQFEKELAEGMQEAEKSAQEADRLLQQMTLEEVRRRAAEEAAEKTAEKDTDAEFRGEEVKEQHGQEGIRIELEGIEPIKIGQED